MYLLYLSESGSHGDSKNLVLAGLAIFERGAYWLRRELDLAVQSAFPDSGEVPLRASALRVPQGERPVLPYSQIDGNARRALLERCYHLIAESTHPRLFATVVEKEWAESQHDARDPYEIAFEDLVSRFDLMLVRLHQGGNTQRGLVVASEANYREHAELLGDRILREGTRWSEARNLADVPTFAPAARTRMLQAASLVANAVYGRYEKALSRDFDRIVEKFDRDGDRLHGLTHLTLGSSGCFCPACVSYRASRSFDADGRERPHRPDERRDGERREDYRRPDDRRDDYRRGDDRPRRYPSADDRPRRYPDGDRPPRRYSGDRGDGGRRYDDRRGDDRPRRYPSADRPAPRASGERSD